MIFIYRFPPKLRGLCFHLQVADAGGQLADMLHSFHDVLLHRHNQYPPKIEWEIVCA